MAGQRILAAKYLANFKCLGSECQDNCCTGWIVRVDEDTLGLFADCPDPEMRELFLQNVISESPEAANPAVSAKIALAEGMACSFLTQDKLCRIHKQMGPGYLPCICYRYPREENLVDGIRERTATMSCPAAAALALLEPAPIQLDLLQEDPDRWPHLFHRELDTASTAGPTSYRAHFHGVRKVILFIMQETKISLDRRLLLTGDFCKKLHQLIDSQQFSLIQVETASAVSQAKSLKRWTEIFSKSMDAAPEAWFPEITKALLDYEILERIVNPAYLTSLDEIRQVFGNDPAANPAGLTNIFRRAEKRFLIPFLKSYPHFLENYLCNLIFKQLFPFEEGKSVLAQYEELILIYALLRIHLAATGTALERLGCAEAIRTVSSFTRVWDTNSTFRARIWQGVKQAKDLSTHL